MEIVTGKTGTPHVSSEDDRALHAGTFGTGNYVLNTGNKLSASIISANSIRLGSGDGVMQGTHFRISHGKYDDIHIDSGTSGYMRKDLIVARYQKVGDIESVTPVVIKGASTTSDAPRPAHTQGNILEGAMTSDMPLYEVALNGVNIASVTSLFSVVTTIYEMDGKITTLEQNLDSTRAQIMEQWNEDLVRFSEQLNSEVKSLTAKHASDFGAIGSTIEQLCSRVSALDGKPFEGGIKTN